MLSCFYVAQENPSISCDGTAGTSSVVLCTCAAGVHHRFTPQYRFIVFDNKATIEGNITWIKCYSQHTGGMRHVIVVEYYLHIIYVQLNSANSNICVIKMILLCWIYSVF